MPKYTLLSELGRGGMGVVFRAHQEPLGREVALKMVLGAIKEHSVDHRRFQREIQACIALSHPGIIKILDAGELEGKPYYVMELLVGATPLDELIRSESPFPLARAFDIAMQLLDALDYTHAHGLLHRDLKPANVMIGPGPRVTLMDFGLVKDLDGTALTQEGSVVGTLRYIAPENVRGQPLGPGIDLWAVGAILYEMLTGAKAFPGATPVEIVPAILTATLLPVRQHRADLPAELDSLLRQFLEKDTTRRVASAAAARNLLERWLEEQSAPPPAPARPTPRETAAVRRSRVSVPPTAVTSVRRAPPAIVGAGVLLTIVLLAAVLGSGRWSGPRPRTGPPSSRRIPIPGRVRTGRISSSPNCTRTPWSPRRCRCRRSARVLLWSSSAASTG